MRIRTIAPLLLVAVACSAFANRRVVQYNAVVEEGYKQVEIYLDAGKLSAEDGKLILAALDLAGKQIDRYWAAQKSGAPADVKKAIFAAIQDALDEAQRLLVEKGQNQ